MKHLFQAELLRFRSWALAAALVHVVALGFMTRIVDLAQQPKTVYQVIAIVYAVLGTLLGPTFMLSAAGAAAALGALALAHRLGRRVLGPVGYAVPAALAHVGAQLVVAYALFVPHAGLWRLAPALLAFATAWL